MMATHSQRLTQRQRDLRKIKLPPSSARTGAGGQALRAVEFDYRRRVIDDIEAMLEKAGAFHTEIYVVDEQGNPGQRVHDVEDRQDADKLRRMAEAIFDYWRQ